MLIEKFRLISHHDSLLLGVMICTPPKGTAVKGILQIVHGMSEHKERYTRTMEYFTAQGYVCIIHDHRGHGESVKSDDDLGYFYKDGTRGIVEDMRQISDYARNRFPNKPLYIIAHSMGTLVTRVYLKKYDYIPSGVFLCGSPSSGISSSAIVPLLDRYSKIGNDHVKAKVVNDMLMDSFDSSFKKEGQKGQKYAWMSSDKTVIENYIKDPKCGFPFTINGYRCLLELMNDTYNDNRKTAQNPNLPIMFLSGSKDPCMTSYKKFIEAVAKQHETGYSYVGYKLYEGLRHGILNEPERETVYRDILDHIELFEYMKEMRAKRYL